MIIYEKIQRSVCVCVFTLPVSLHGVYLFSINNGTLESRGGRTTKKIFLFSYVHTISGGISLFNCGIVFIIIS